MSEDAKSIWKKLFLSIAIPFFLVFGLLLFSIVHSVYKDKVETANKQLANKIRFNEEHLQNLIDSVRLTTMTAADLLNRLDANQPDARRHGEQIIQRMLQNRSVYNAWLVFEPNAFDGRDAEDRDGYPGAPSGRYIRSYVRDRESKEKIVVAPDVDESILDDPRQSSWYRSAVLSRRPYISINEETLHDYGIGEGLRNIYSIAIPLFRNGAVIGCVGADGNIEDLVRDDDTGVVSAILSYRLKLTAAPRVGDVGKKLEDLSFTNLAAVKEALLERKPVLFERETFALAGGGAQVSFVPVDLSFFRESLWIVTAMPLTNIYESMYPIVTVAILSMLVFVCMFYVLFSYMARLVSRPVLAMTRVADTLNLDDTHLQVSRGKNEMRQFTGSFYRMLEILHRKIGEARWQQEILDFHLFVESNLSAASDLTDFFRRLAHRFIRIYGARRMSLQLLEQGNREIREAVWYDRDSGFETRASAPEVWQILLAQAENSPLPIWREDADDCLCVLPLRIPERLLGGVFLHFDRQAPEEIKDYLSFLAEMISHRLAGHDMNMD